MKQPTIQIDELKNAINECIIVLNKMANAREGVAPQDYDELQRWITDAKKKFNTVTEVANKF